MLISRSNGSNILVWLIKTSYFHSFLLFNDPFVGFLILRVFPPLFVCTNRTNEPYAFIFSTSIFNYKRWWVTEFCSTSALKSFSGHCFGNVLTKVYKLLDLHHGVTLLGNSLLVTKRSSKVFWLPPTVRLINVTLVLSLAETK